MSQTEASVMEKQKFKTPSLWTVVLHNDDFTPMDFVVAILTEIFRLDMETAKGLMLVVHEKGSAPVGKFSKEIAQTKAAHVVHLAEQCGHPLNATPEEL